MTLAALLFGISKGARKIVNSMLISQAQGLERDAARKLISSAIGERLEAREFNRQWGVLRNAVSDWDQMNRFARDEIVSQGYRGVVTKLPRRFRTVVNLHAVNRETGEVFELNTTIQHDDLLTREQIREKAIKAISQNQSTNVDFGDERIVAGFRSR